MIQKLDYDNNYILDSSYAKEKARELKKEIDIQK